MTLGCVRIYWHPWDIAFWTEARWWCIAKYIDHTSYYCGPITVHIDRRNDLSEVTN